MAQFNQTDTAVASVSNPNAGDYAWFTDGGILKLKDSSGTVTIPGNQSGRFLLRTIKTSGTTFTTGANTTKLIVNAWGGGGASGSVAGSGSTASASGGGAAGSPCMKVYTVTPSTGYTYAIGAAGAAAGTGNHDGGDGGDSTFTDGVTLMTAKGGKGGKGDPGSGTASIAIGGAGQLSTNGDINGTGEPGGYGSTNVPGGGSVQVSGKGGSSPWGGGGNSVVTSGVGFAAANVGTGYASGGGGVATYADADRAGAAGTQGIIIFDEYSG